MCLMQKWRNALGVMCLTAFLLMSCSKKEAPKETASPAAGPEKPETAPAGPQAQPETTEVVLPLHFNKHTDDLEGMVKRRNIRALVLLNPIGFFYDKGQPHGVNYEALQEFEKFVNQKFKTGTLIVKVTFLPVRADQAEGALTQGMGDLITYALVITPERQQRVAFTTPLQTDVKQIIVSGANFGTVSSLDDLGGKEVYVNPLGVNYQNLQRVNETLQKAGKCHGLHESALSREGRLRVRRSSRARGRPETGRRMGRSHHGHQKGQS
jgi:ABC-type amino acid transport substrate-binding protein